jgi:5-methylcytosine-specific restriction endonuclease McrA
MAFSNTRSVAKTKGEHLYFTGVPCKHGHVAARFTRTAICTDCNREQTKLWAAANKAKKQAADAAYRKNNLEEKRAKDREYYRDNKDSILAKNREYFARTVDARHAAAKVWREANPEKSKAASARFRQANPHKINAWAALRRARKKQAERMLPPDQLAQIQAVYAEARRLSEATGVRHEVDHICPLAGTNFSGLHVPWNLQILTSDANKRKGNKFEEAA